MCVRLSLPSLVFLLTEDDSVCFRFCCVLVARVRCCVGQKLENNGIYGSAAAYYPTSCAAPSPILPAVNKYTEQREGLGSARTSQPNTHTYGTRYFTTPDFPRFLFLLFSEKVRDSEVAYTQQSAHGRPSMLLGYVCNLNHLEFRRLVISDEQISHTLRPPAQTTAGTW